MVDWVASHSAAVFDPVPAVVFTLNDQCWLFPDIFERTTAHIYGLAISNGIFYELFCYGVFL